LVPRSIFSIGNLEAVGAMPQEVKPNIKMADIICFILMIIQFLWFVHIRYTMQRYLSYLKNKVKWKNIFATPPFLMNLANLVIRFF